MNVLDNSQEAAQGDNLPANPDELGLDDIPFVDDDAETPDPEDQDPPEGDDPEADDDADPQAAQDKPKAIADDAEYTLPDGRKVTVGEMAKSFADFTVKTQELAAERNQSRQDALQAISQTRESQAQQLQFIAQHITQLVAPGITEQALYQLAQQDPDAYFQQKARLDAAQNFLAQITQHSQQLQQQAQQAKQQAEQEAAAFRQQRMQETAQVLGGQKWFNADFGNRALAYMKTAGLPPDAIDAINQGMGGAGAIELIRKAMLYDEAVKQRKTNKQPAPQTRATPGAKPAQGLMGKTKQLNKTYEAAKKGDRHAMGAWLDNVL